jgi:hypothetical protein
VTLHAAANLTNVILADIRDPEASEELSGLLTQVGIDGVNMHQADSYRYPITDGSTDT